MNESILCDLMFFFVFFVSTIVAVCCIEGKVMKSLVARIWIFYSSLCVSFSVTRSRSLIQLLQIVLPRHGNVACAAHNKIDMYSLAPAKERLRRVSRYRMAAGVDRIHFV